MQTLINKVATHFATKLQASSTKNTKDSAGRRLGLKKSGGQAVYPQDILVRQRGLQWHAGKNTYVGKDHTIHSKVEGKVYFTQFKQNFHRGMKSVINVEEMKNDNKSIRTPKPHVYHPELFPHLQQYNPQPMDLKLKQKQVKQKHRFKGFVLKEEEERHGLDVEKVKEQVMMMDRKREMVGYDEWCSQYVDELFGQLDISTRARQSEQ